AFFRRHRAEASVILGVAALHVLFYASYDTWAGRACWGPRHIVPITPFVALLLAPAIVWAWRSRIWAAALLALGAVSAGIQAIGSSVDFFAYLSWLGAQGPDVENTLGIYDPAYSPILGNLRFTTPATLDYAWAYAGGVAGQIDPVPIVLALALAVAAGVAMWAAAHWRARRRWDARRVALLALTAVLAMGGLVAAVLPRYQTDPRFGTRQDERDAIAYLEGAVRPGDALIVTTTADLGVFWNTNRARVPWYSLYPSIPPDWTNKVDAVLRGAVARERRLWLVLDGLAPGDPNSGVERWLSEHTYPIRQESVGDLRLCLYACPAAIAPLADTPAHPTDARLGEAITLLGYTLGDGPFRPGGEVPLSLYWRAETPVSADYTVFVQLLGPDGLPVAQIDSYPVAGFRPTGSWAVGEVIRDNYGLAVPAGAPAGRYRLISGMYDLATMQRLPVTPAGGDFVLLAELDM
ncbi:MAG: hypothetical protein KJ734_12500, partial [Chloroflexi bacterium]|nr:hypothetical protein [Chloroflexota bacterium]